MATSRIYQGRDVDMLTTSATIIENAMVNQDFLTSKRGNWAPPFFENLKIRINKAFNSYLGIDSAAELRRATKTVIQIQTQALANLAELKIQIEADFKSNAMKYSNSWTTPLSTKRR